MNIPTPRGTVTVTVEEDDGALRGVTLGPGVSGSVGDGAGGREMPWRGWLGAYARREPEPVLNAWLPEATTPFQHRLRRVLLAIPFGETRRYGEVAAELGSSPRAVGRALASNPLPLMIPCHRVVARDGLGGFQGGETEETLWIKAGLLAHESGHGVG